MIKKRLRVAPGSVLPAIAAIAALITAAAFVFNLWVSSSQYELLRIDQVTTGDALYGERIGWLMMLGGMALMIPLCFAAKKEIRLLAVPALVYAAGMVVSELPHISDGSIKTEGWILVIGVAVFAILFVLTLLSVIKLKEPVIILGLFAIAGVAVLTLLQREPFIVTRATWPDQGAACLSLSKLLQTVGFFLTSLLIAMSLDSAYSTELAGVRKDEQERKSDRPKERPTSKKAESSSKKDSDESDGGTINWALLRPAGTQPPKKTPVPEPEELDTPDAPAETAEAAPLEESLDETNRRIAEEIAQGPTFEEEMQLLDEIEKNNDTAAPVEEFAADYDRNESEPAETAETESGEPKREKSLVELLAERGLLNREGNLPSGTVIPAPKAAEVAEETAEDVAQAAESFTETAGDIETAAETTLDAADDLFGELSAAAEVTETVEEAAAETAETVAAANESAAEFADDAAESILDEVSDSEPKAETQFGKKRPTAKAVYEEPKDTSEEDTGDDTFSAKGKFGKKSGRVSEAAEKVASDEPVLTVPVTPITGSRLQKVLKEEVVTDREQKLMSRRRVSIFAIIGMCLSAASLVIGVLTTFKVISIPQLQDEKMCFMFLGLGLIMFLVFGTRLTYKEYYTKTVLNERKVVHEENNWEEYVANRLEEDEKNIATLAQNYMRMTEMYGRLLETTAELTDSVKKLSMRKQASLEVSDEVPVERAAEEPTEATAEAFSEEAPETERFADFAFAPAEPEHAAYEPSAYEDLSYDEPAYEEPKFEEAAAEVEEAVAEVEETVAEEVAEATEEVAEAVGETEEAAAEIAEEFTEQAAEAAEQAEEVAEQAAEAAERAEEVAEQAAEATEQAEEVVEQVEETVKQASSEPTSANESIISALFANIGKKKVIQDEEPEKTETVERVEEAVSETAETVTEVAEEAAEEVKVEEPAEEPVKAAEPEPEPEPVHQGSYNDFLISTLFGRRKPVKKVEEPVEEVVEKAAEAVQETAAETVEEATEEVAEATEEITEATEEITEAAEEITEAAEETVAEATAEVAEATEEITEAAEEITEAAEETVEEATEEVAKATEEITETAEEITEAAEETVAEATEEVAEATEEITEETEAFSEEAAEATEEISESAEEITEAAEETVEEATEEVAEAAEEAVAEAEDASRGFVQKELLNPWLPEELITDSQVGKAAETAEETVEDSVWNVTEEAAEAAKAAVDFSSDSEPVKPTFGAFGYGMTLADEETENTPETMTLQFSGNSTQTTMFGEDAINGGYEDNPFFETPTEEVPEVTDAAEEIAEALPETEAEAFGEEIAEELPETETFGEEIAEELPETEAFGEEIAEELPETEAFGEEAALPETDSFAAAIAELNGAVEAVGDTLGEAAAEAEETIADNAEAVKEAVAETAETVAEAKPEAEAEPAEAPKEERKPTFYRKSIYDDDIMGDDTTSEGMPKVNIPEDVTNGADKKDEGIIEGFVMPTFRGFTYSDDYEPSQDDTEEKLYSGTYKMKSFLSRKTAQDEQMNQYLYSDDDDEFGLGDKTDDGSIYHGSEVPEMPIPETEEVVEADDMFAEPELPMSEAEFEEPALPETHEWDTAEDDWNTPSIGWEPPKPEPEAPKAPATPEDERAKLEARRKMLQEKLDLIRKKNQETQFDDLSDLDDEGVFFHNDKK